MRTKLWLPAVLGLCMVIACAKKPTPEECQLAVGNLTKLLGRYVIEQMKGNIVGTGEVAAAAHADMDKALKEIDASTGLEDVDQRNFEVCAKQERTRVICVSTAKTLDETVTACGMKQNPGGPGEKNVSWPD
jgi:hypothetical protein